jgi:HAD superfamily hydrolase (TIGR01549 family)
MNRRIDPTEARNQRWSDLYRWAGSPVSKLEASRISARYRREYLRHERPIAGVTRFLDRLSGFAKLAIVSNNLKREQRAKVNSLGLTARFRVIVTSEEVRAAKPDREIFLAALDRLNAKPEESAFVGDSWVADVLGARNAGLSAVWFNPRGLPSPDPSLALELRSYRPLEPALDLIRTSVVLEED